MEIVAESSVYHALLLRHSAPKLAWLKEQTLELAKCHAETEVAQPQEPSGDDGRDQVQELAKHPKIKRLLHPSSFEEDVHDAT